MILRLSNVVETAIQPALALLPKHMDSPEARCLMLAIGLQESEFTHRRQKGGGPARGFWQFERGTRETRGGVWGVYLHRASHELLRLLCKDRDVNFDPSPIYHALETDDILAAGVARLMLWTDPKKLPALGERQAAWDCYDRIWNPGKPRPDEWPENYSLALHEVKGSHA